MEQFLTKAKHTELSRLSVSPSGHRLPWDCTGDYLSTEGQRRPKSSKI